MPPKLSDVAPPAAGQPATGSSLSDDQFAQLVELLTPGYELSKMYLADYNRQRAADEKFAAEKKAADDAAAKAADETPKG